MTRVATDPRSQIAFPTKVGRKPSLPVWFSSLGIASVVMLLVALCYLYINNFGNEGFWTDETTTFWQSGLAFPLSDKGSNGIQEMFAAVRGGSADPGGFNVLLLAWISIFGTAVESLRSFAFFFFVMYLFFLWTLMRWLALPTIVSAAALGLMLLENITPYYAFELRPYIPELAASVGFLVVTLFLLQQPSKFRLTIFLAGIVFLGSSQYSAAVLSITTGIIFLAIFIWNRGGTKNSLLLVAASSAILWPVVQYTLLRGFPFRREQAPPTHTVDLLMSNRDFNQLMQNLNTNLLTPTAFPRTAFLILIPILWIWFRYSSRSNTFTIPVRNALILMWFYVALATLFSALLSLMGVMPWILGTRWSINEIGLIAISLIGILVVIFNQFESQLGKLTTQILVATMCIIVVTVGSVRIFNYERVPASRYLASLSEKMFSGTPGGLIIDNWILEDTRYLIEASGRYDELQGSWSTAEPRGTSGFEAATSIDVSDFLADTTADRILLRSEVPLETVIIPTGVEVLRSDAVDGAPVLLIKDSS